MRGFSIALVAWFLCLLANMYWLAFVDAYSPAVNLVNDLLAITAWFVLPLVGYAVTGKMRVTYVKELTKKLSATANFASLMGSANSPRLTLSTGERLLR